MSRRVVGLPPTFKQFGSFDSVSAREVTSLEAWVERQLVHYEDRYTKMDPLTFVILTFNAACKKPPADLSFVLQGDPPTSAPLEPDVVVVGLQEVDMSATALLMEETEAAIPWIVALRDAIGADAERNSDKPYYPICVRQLVGIMLLVFVKKTLLPYMRGVQIQIVATGTFGAVGNKGAVAVRCVFHNTSICILNCHLAAHEHALAKRNEDLAQIMNQCLFSGGPSNPNEAFAAGPPVHIGPKDHEIVIVFGDLNYRVVMSYEKAVSLANNGQYPVLLSCDQLCAELASTHSVWAGFAEFTPTFPPTYRYDIGTSIYDTSEKKRVPSYTDRIMYWAKDARHAQIKLLSLRCFQDVVSSDHKPVRAVVHVPVQRTVPELRKEMIVSLRDTVSRLGLDMVTIAKTSVSCASLDFGVQSYTNHGEKRHVIIENTGECVAWVTVHRREEGDISEASWVRVFPLTLRIFPKQSKEIEVSSVMDRRALEFMPQYRPFSGEAEKALKSLLILTVSDGPTHFIECTVKVRPSCFGNTLENLYQLQHLPCSVAYAQQEAPPVAHRPQIPKEVWLLCDALLRRCKSEESLFLQEGKKQEVLALIKYLDNNMASIPDELASAVSIADCLIKFLRDLQVPLVPPAMNDAVLAAVRQGGSAPCLGVLSSLPPVHANVLVYVFSFLKHLLRRRGSNALTPEVLSSIFASVMFSLEKPSQGMTQEALQSKASAERVGVVSFILSILRDSQTPEDRAGS